MDGSLSRPGQPPPGTPEAAADRSSIVACQQCGARYKLDEGRISGRGAKITCPKCRNVFVVRRDASGKLSTGAAAVEAEVSAAPVAGAALSGPSAWEVLPPTDPGFGPAALAALSGARGAPAVAAAPLAPIDVNTLDFRRVGIQSWKVKVKIGLVYDFSDFKTLSKYIHEGRITPADRISHKAGDWTLISDIASLEQHFIDVYRGAEAALLASQAPAAESKGEGGGAEDYESDEPTNIVGMEGMQKPGVEITNEVPKASSRSSHPPAPAPAFAPARPAASPESASAIAAMSTGNPAADTRQFHDPFDKKGAPRGAKKGGGRSATTTRPEATAPPRASAEAKAISKEAAKSSGAGGIGVVGVSAVLVFLACGAAAVWYFYLREPAPSAVGAPIAAAGPASAAGPTAEAGTTGAPSDRGEVIGQITENTKPVEAEKDDWGIEEDPVLIPVGPRGGTPSRASTSPPSQAGGARSAPPAAAGAGTSSAADHAAVGDDAARNRDWANAAQAYANAVQADPRNATYATKYGEALYRSGDLAGATQALTKATQLGSKKAWRFLGDIARDQGDAAAISAYQKYLQSGPSDAAQVQAEIDKLQKG
jgi:predicted Zn finger-like uncharacterized protein